MIFFSILITPIKMNKFNTRVRHIKLIYVFKYLGIKYMCFDNGTSISIVYRLTLLIQLGK